MTAREILLRMVCALDDDDDQRFFAYFEQLLEVVEKSAKEELLELEEKS